MSRTLARWWSSIAFRQTLIFGALVVFTMTVLLAVFYVQTVGVWQRRIDSQINATAQRLVDYHKRSGALALGAHINSLLGDGIDSDTEVYTLLGSDGHIVAGNLAVTGEITTPMRSISEHRVLRAGRPSRSRLRVTALGDGSILIVGRDMQDQHELEQLIRGAIFSGAIVTLLMAVVGALLFQRQLERRIGAIRATAAQIERGDLAQRVPISAQQDEFARLSRDINAMLDRIHALAAAEQQTRFELTATYLALTANVVVAAIQEAGLREQVRTTRELIAADEKSWRSCASSRLADTPVASTWPHSKPRLLRRAPRSRRC